MRTLYTLVAAACLLAAPLASTAQCGQGTANVTGQRGGPGTGGAFKVTGTQLANEVEGAYALSNGRRLALLHLDQAIYADFERWQRVRLEEVGTHRVASREGDIQMTWVPGQRTDSILLSYPGNGRGELKRSC
ncbi:hypothetical protein [Telluria aromaticivorans]|uniref:Uncharacterized protein n=1 Tax=Telluria aromaticivorans TaxID=2725995 RepID=A0A7Y2NZX6_9BURK|nr:hypothetical protein [Telluria aromaticivorans]NNG22961.1 hypothetical protein [Telluria aromaticivorans]